MRKQHYNNVHLQYSLTYSDRWQLCCEWIGVPTGLETQEVRDMHWSNIQISIFFHMTCVGFSSNNFKLMMQSFSEQILLIEENNIIKTNTAISTKQQKHSKTTMGTVPHEQFTSHWSQTVTPDDCHCFKNVLYNERAN